MTAARHFPHALRHGRALPTALPCLLVGLTLFGPSLRSQGPPPPEEPNEKAAKYHEALVRRPSGGHLFERFHHAWLDTGSVAGLESFLVRRAETEGAAPGETLLLAFFFSKQGKDGKAVEIFEKALAADPGNGEAWLEKAKAEARLLDFDAALADLEKASATSPKDETTVEIGKLKGRLLARSGRGEDALAAWGELATGHADDEELLEDLVDLHLVEGLVNEAVSLMERLVEKSTDAYLKVTRQLRLGDIHQRAGKREEAIALYDQGLDAAGRDTWLEKEVLAQIEQVFRREDDLAGLEKHLASRIEADAGRIAVRKRRALVLAELQQSDEAAAAFAEILKLTPGDRGNREAYVDLLGRLGKHAEAAEQMAALATLHPNDAELSAQLAVRHHAAGQSSEAKAAVSSYLAKSDGAEYAHLRAARLLEQFGEDTAAGETYALLLAAFPGSIAAKEAQAEFLHRTGQREEAVAVWKGIAAAGTEQDALRVARSLSGRGERETAYAILLERAETLADDFSFLGQLCVEAATLRKHEEALPWAEKRLALATSPAELNDTMRQLVSFLETVDRTAAYSETLATKSGRSLAETCLLAELLERDGRHDEAEKTLRPALESGEALAIGQQVRLFRARDEWSRAAETQQRLVDLPDGRTASNVQELVQLHRRAAAYDEALRWIEEWKKLSPGAVNIPMADLERRLAELPKDREIVAYCRGPYCVLSFEAVERLRSKGYRVRRLEDGFPEWMAAGLKVETGA